MPPLEERVEYPYQNIRTRNFPWGDGDKVCSTPNRHLLTCQRIV
jgi:cytochrome c oxidase subunit 6a